MKEITSKFTIDEIKSIVIKVNEEFAKTNNSYKFQQFSQGVKELWEIIGRHVGFQVNPKGCNVDQKHLGDAPSIKFPLADGIGNGRKLFKERWELANNPKFETNSAYSTSACHMMMSGAFSAGSELDEFFKGICLARKSIKLDCTDQEYLITRVIINSFYGVITGGIITVPAYNKFALNSHYNNTVKEVWFMFQNSFLYWYVDSFILTDNIQEIMEAFNRKGYGTEIVEKNHQVGSIL